jgi:hypothetical protein
MGSLTTAQVLRAISDDKSMHLFRLISQNDNGIDSESLKGQSKLTRKQYYSRLSRLTRTGLVKRRKGRYSMTLLGKIVYSSQSRIDTALSNYWKLKAIDSLETSKELPIEEQQKLIDSMLKDQKELRDIVGNKIKYPEA